MKVTEIRVERLKGDIDTNVDTNIDTNVDTNVDRRQEDGELDYQTA